VGYPQGAGGPAFPDPYAPQYQQQGFPARHAPVWSDASETALLPPVVDAPAGAPSAHSAAAETTVLPPLANAPGAQPGQGFGGPTAGGHGFAIGGFAGEQAAAAPQAQAPAPGSAAAPASARSGSPIIDPGVESALGTAVAAALIAGGAALGRPALLVAVALLQVVTSAGWFRLNGMWPARQGIALAFLGGLVADVAAAAVDSPVAGVLAGALGAFFLLVMVLQVFRPADPKERFYALTVCASATVVTVLDGGFAGALDTGHGKNVVVVSALGAAVAVLVASAADRVLPTGVAFGAGFIVPLVLGAALGTAWGGPGAGAGALTGAVAAACGLIGRRVAAYDFPSRFVHRTAGVALPLALAAPLALLVGLLV